MREIIVSWLKLGLSLITLADNGTTKVTKFNNFVFKTQPEEMCDREMKFLNMFYRLGLTPLATRTKRTEIMMDYIAPQPVTDIASLRQSFKWALAVMKAHNVEHNDLTEKNIIVGYNNTIIIIDWSESKFVDEDYPQKRKWNDAYWARVSFYRICGHAL